MRPLTLAELKLAARDFVRELSLTPIADLYGATDGKAIGTYVGRSSIAFCRRISRTRPEVLPAALISLTWVLTSKLLRYGNPSLPALFVKPARRFTGWVII